MQELPVINPVTNKLRKPDWLRVKLPIGDSYKHVRGLVDHNKLHTICESGNYPNIFSATNKRSSYKSSSYSTRGAN